MHMHNEPENKLFQQNILLVLFSILFLFVYNKKPNIRNRQKNFLLNFLLFFVD